MSAVRIFGYVHWTLHIGKTFLQKFIFHIRKVIAISIVELIYMPVKCDCKKKRSTHTDWNIISIKCNIKTQFDELELRHIEEAVWMCFIECAINLNQQTEKTSDAWTDILRKSMKIAWILSQFSIAIYFMASVLSNVYTNPSGL